MWDKIIEYVVTRKKYDANFYNSIVKMYERNSIYSGKLIHLIVRSISLFTKPKDNSIKYFFWGNKYSEIITGMPKSQVCVIGGPKQLLFCLKYQLKFLPCMRVWQTLLYGIKNSETFNNEKLITIIDQLVAIFAGFKSDKSILIVDNDSLPTQRVVITAARTAKIDEVVCIQHGIFQSVSPKHILDGWFSDRFFVINEFQKQLLIEKGMDKQKVNVMGFHTSPYKPKRLLSSIHDRKVCFLGQPWLKYDSQKGQRYTKIINLVRNSLNLNGIKLNYKPHPWENDFSFLDENDNIFNYSLNKAIENFDVFISLTSTALLETGASGRIAIQVYDDIYESDKMEIYDGISTIPSFCEDFNNKLLDLINKEMDRGTDSIKPVVERFLLTLEGNNI